jgi:hypothetical protein
MEKAPAPTVWAEGLSVAIKLITIDVQANTLTIKFD